MIRSIIRLSPHTHRANLWQGGEIEPKLRDMLNDPMVALVMRRDGISPEILLEVISAAQTVLRGPLCRRIA